MRLCPECKNAKHHKMSCDSKHIILTSPIQTESKDEDCVELLRYEVEHLQITLDDYQRQILDLTDALERATLTIDLLRKGEDV